MDLLKVYEKLLKKYGKQHWWPIYNSITDKFEYFSWDYRHHKNNQQKLEVCLGAILTQGTNWKNVEKVIRSLKKKDLLDIDVLSHLSKNKLAFLIKSSGYYNQKARKIKEFIKFLNLNIKVTRENLLKVWGIGPETADSILLYAYGIPYFVIDAYTKKFCKDLGIIMQNYEDYRLFFENNLPRNLEIYKEFHALIVRCGKEKSFEV